MSAYDLLLERAAASLPGVTTGLLQGELAALLRDFFKQSRAWREILEDLSTENEILDLGKENLSGKILGVIGPLWTKDRYIWPASWAPKVQRAPGMTPAYYHTLPSSFIRFRFSPPLGDELTGLNAEVYLAPLHNGVQSIPDMLLELHEEALLAGLQGRMMLKPKKPYTDAQLGAENMREYRMGVNQARHMANKGRTTAPELWIFPGWG